MPLVSAPVAGVKHVAAGAVQLPMGVVAQQTVAPVVGPPCRASCELAVFNAGSNPNVAPSGRPPSTSWRRGSPP